MEVQRPRTTQKACSSRSLYDIRLRSVGIRLLAMAAAWCLLAFRSGIPTYSRSLRIPILFPYSANSCLAVGHIARRRVLPRVLFL